ncbi:hypothetical protein CF70_010165 [Cupriavidus sp. SK-3]|nr:hypothetical protein CF70_010165 [Cupriavidus sp. SK-3]
MASAVGTALAPISWSFIGKRYIMPSRFSRSNAKTLRPLFSGRRVPRFANIRAGPEAVEIVDYH